MTAGRGIVHSERTPAQLRASGSRAFGIQTWIALPRAHEEAEPAFVHAGVDRLPVIESPECRLRLIVGTLFGARSPVPTLSDMFYAEVVFEAGGRLLLPLEHEDRAAYIAEGAIEFDGQRYEAGRMLVFRPGGEAAIAAPTAARVMLLGGAPLESPRHLWWNFVSSRKERIEQAASDWKEGRFPPVPEETEFIPLPERNAG
jgi:redox-sensitive bicupin YhaK (pirin superfamily)